MVKLGSDFLNGLKQVRFLPGSILAMLIILVLAACGDTATSAPTTTNAVAATTAASTTPLATTSTATTTTSAPTTTPVATTTIAPTTIAATTTAPTTVANTTSSTTTNAATSTTTTITTTSIATTTTSETGTASAASGDPAKGKVVFVTNCQACHPDGGTTQGFGPNLSTSPHALDPAYITGNVRNGRGNMPQFSKTEVSDNDLTNIIAYLKSIHK